MGGCSGEELIGSFAGRASGTTGDFRDGEEEKLEALEDEGVRIAGTTV